VPAGRATEQERERELAGRRVEIVDGRHARHPAPRRHLRRQRVGLLGTDHGDAGTAEAVEEATEELLRGGVGGDVAFDDDNAAEGLAGDAALLLDEQR